MKYRRSSVWFLNGINIATELSGLTFPDSGMKIASFEVCCHRLFMSSTVGGNWEGRDSLKINRYLAVLRPKTVIFGP